MSAIPPAVPVVRVRDLRKTFVLSGPWPWSSTREVEALKGVDLEVHAGQVMAVVGQSGSGKTTLSRLVLGLEEPSSGEVWLEGRRWDGLSEAERQPRRVHFQYVPQDAMSALDPQQTAVEHVVETLRVLRGHDRARAREEADALLGRLGLAERRDALPRQMSGGEQRRVTLARVLALDPHLVVADEPTSGLDPDRREEVLSDLVGNLPRGAACILVTHDMVTTRAWCTHAVVMLDGWVIESFDPRLAEPLHPYSRLLFDPWSAPLPSSGPARQGCPFHPDCPLAIDVCHAAMPALEPSDGHRVACHAVRAASERQTASP